MYRLKSALGLRSTNPNSRNKQVKSTSVTICLLNVIGFNAVKCNLTKLTTKSSFWSVLLVWHCRLSAICHCTRLSMFQCGGPSMECSGHRIQQFSFRAFLFPPSSQSPQLTSLEDCMGAHGWVQGLPAMGVLYFLGVGWSQWRSLDIPASHLPYSMTQLLTLNTNLTRLTFLQLVLLAFLLQSFLLSLQLEALFSHYMQDLKETNQFVN